MKNSVTIGTILILTFFATISFASEPSITANEITVSKTVKKLTGNVVITFEDGEGMTFNADKMFRNENEFILEGNVEFKSDNCMIHTEKATVPIVNNHKVMFKNENGFILEKNVEIKSDSFMIRTEKATVHIKNHNLKIKMDSCEFINI